MNMPAKTFGSPSGEPSTTRPMHQQMCEKLWTLPVFKDEVLTGAKSADDPPEEMPERHDHGKTLSELSEFSFAQSHSFCRCTTFWLRYCSVQRA